MPAPVARKETKKPSLRARSTRLPNGGKVPHGCFECKVLALPQNYEEELLPMIFVRIQTLYLNWYCDRCSLSAQQHEQVLHEREANLDETSV